jgi:hypothetical protein
MINAIRRLLARLGGSRELQLEQRIERLKSALAYAKARNILLAAQLQEQRNKTRELYARTKEYARRLNDLS